MIANIERVANLFVTKTVYAMLLALAVVGRSAGRTRSCPATSRSSARPHDRHPGVLPRARAERPSLRAGLPPARPAFSVPTGAIAAVWQFPSATWWPAPKTSLAIRPAPPPLLS